VQCCDVCVIVQVTASGDTTIGQWDVVRGESVATYKSHTGSVKSVDVKRDEPSEPYTYYTVLYLPSVLSCKS
jgi:WD40 repeat protein